MDSQQQQLTELLTSFHLAWKELQNSDDVTKKKQVKDAIKQLSKLQDAFNDLQDNDSRQLWDERASSLIRKIKRLKLLDEHRPEELDASTPALSSSTTAISHPASNADASKPSGMPSANLFNRPRQATSVYSSPFNSSRLIQQPLSSTSTPPWTSSARSLRPDPLTDSAQRLSLDVSRPNRDSEDHDTTPPATSPPSGSDSLTIGRLPKSNSSLSMFSLPADVIDAPVPQRTVSKTHTTRSTMIDQFARHEPSTSTSSKRSFSLFGKKQPEPQPSTAQINFYRDDGDDNQVYACDAIVNHPLRIGIGYGSYICYSCTVFSNKGAPITVRKRYSDFVVLRQQLLKHYPHLKASVPKLPPKKVVGKFTPTFVEQRRRELEYFFKYVVLHPTLGSGQVIKEWIAP
ncbi:hypothetical protein DM01DRAFT_1336878 [Hesseltinella vesiculosa]|uniref:PX domain-containing protein n=1 Tax=Hesseltinella vesiculosa TaxID=101127 RepID=A0A1X2GE97_9FUNG|nr:hypothetical protein DM01DRAFT_1336878 [Hesseltinella vesiculosa]